MQGRAGLALVFALGFALPSFSAYAMISASDEGWAPGVVLIWQV